LEVPILSKKTSADVSAIEPPAVPVNSSHLYLQARIFLASDALDFS
jgi:hypothetical protein